MIADGRSADSCYPDGPYEVLVVDGGGDRIEAVVTEGVHKGEVFVLRATGLAVDPIELLGLPATVTIVDGQPSFQL